MNKKKDSDDSLNQLSNDSKSKEMYYMENGFLVFTEEYHLKRGYCCKNNCRHCPFLGNI